MTIEQTSNLVIYDEQKCPTHVVIFSGREHTFYNLERCSADDLTRVLSHKLIDKKI